MTYSVPLKIVLLTLFSSVNSLTDWEKECLDSHNSFRNLYAYKTKSPSPQWEYLPLPTVGWDEDLAAGAREYCESIVNFPLMHSAEAKNGLVGENLARNTWDSSCSAAVKQFHNREYFFYFAALNKFLKANPAYNYPGKVYQLQKSAHTKDRHFRTMCGKDQTKIGCARCDKNGAYTTVCRYGSPSYSNAFFHLKVKKSI